MARCSTSIPTHERVHDWSIILALALRNEQAFAFFTLRRDFELLLSCSCSGKSNIFTGSSTFEKGGAPGCALYSITCARGWDSMMPVVPEGTI